VFTRRVTSNVQPHGGCIKETLDPDIRPNTIMEPTHTLSTSTPHNSLVNDPGPSLTGDHPNLDGPSSQRLPRIGVVQRHADTRLLSKLDHYLYTTSSADTTVSRRIRRDRLTNFWAAYIRFADKRDPALVSKYVTYSKTSMLSVSTFIFLVLFVPLNHIICPC